MGARTKSGRLKERKAIDRGTDQLKAVKKWFAQDADPALAEYPLGIMFAAGTIGDHQRQVGHEYAWLHAVVHGRPSWGAMAYERLDRGRNEDWGSKWLQAQESRLKAVYGVLKPYPARLKMVLDNTIVYERKPRWMLPVIPRVSDVREADLFMEGLSILTGCLEPRKAA